MTKRSQARSHEAIDFARNQRRTSNEFAATVWQWIRNRQIYGAKFRREFPIPPYTVDFCCVDQKLIIEIDGEAHVSEAGIQHDRVRDQFLTSLGYKILRIPGYEAIREDGNAIDRIRKFVQDSIDTQDPSPPAPLPFVPQGRGEQK